MDSKVERFERWSFVREKRDSFLINSFVQFMFLSDEGPTLEISSTPTFLYFDVYLNTAYDVYLNTAYDVYLNTAFDVYLNTAYDVNLNTAFDVNLNTERSTLYLYSLQGEPTPSHKTDKNCFKETLLRCYVI